MKDTELNYTKAISRLEEITGQMERGEVSLDEVVSLVAEAKQLMQYREWLENTKRKILDYSLCILLAYL